MIRSFFCRIQVQILTKICTRKTDAERGQGMKNCLLIQSGEEILGKQGESMCIEYNTVKSNNISELYIILWHEKVEKHGQENKIYLLDSDLDLSSKKWWIFSPDFLVNTFLSLCLCTTPPVPFF